MDYRNSISEAMNYLSTLDNSIFLGQAVTVAGTSMSTTLDGVPKNKLVEFPVEEEMQLGVSIGLAIQGFLPITIFPRWNFLLLATNQLVNHLDKLKEVGNFEIPPKIIIRTGIGSISPLYPGPQHIGDFSQSFKLMCPNINIVLLDKIGKIEQEYKLAADRNDGVSTILVELSDLYS